MTLQGRPNELVCEVKSRRGCAGFTKVMKWLDGNDALMLFENGRGRGFRGVVLRPDVYYELVRGYYGGV